MLLSSLTNAEQFVAEQQALGNDVRWDGWDIVFYREADHGIWSPDGAFRNGTWGFDNRYAVNGNGEWEIDAKDVRRSKRVGG